MADKWSKLELQVNSGVIKHKRHLTGVKTQFFSGQMMEEDKKKREKKQVLEQETSLCLQSFQFKDPASKCIQTISSNSPNAEKTQLI